MLNIGKLAGVDSVDYYLSQVASGVEDYYLGNGEAPGVWTGTAAGHLGLHGQVEAQALRQVLGGYDTSGEPLEGLRASRKVPGFDLAFRAPKSVSLLWALGGSDVAGDVRDAHDAAVAAALAYLEEHAGWSRRGAGGRHAVKGRGFIAAAFRHRASRDRDPLLHTHVLVANAVQADDGRWGTLDATRLYRHAKTAGYLYQAQLRHELTRRLGVTWNPVANGVADLAGVPDAVIRAFSQRRTAIEQRLADRGDTSAAAAQTAALDTRTPKQQVDAVALAAEWLTRAAALGFTREQLASLLGRTTPRTVTRAQLRHILEELSSPGGLTRHTAVFGRRDVVQALCERLDADATTVLNVAEEITAPTRTPFVALDPATAPATLSDGQLGHSRHPARSEPRYTTPELLATERQVFAAALRRRGDHAGVADQRSVATALARFAGLTGEQAAMVRRLCRDGDGIAVVVGKAGSGKTVALAAARDAWHQTCLHVVGCALAGRAAQELTASAGIPSHTIDRLLGWLDTGDTRGALTSRSVLVVDEAGMVDTRTLARLVRHTTRARAKLVLVGDDHQLPEIGAGGAFRGLVNRLPAITLDTNRRQHHAWERAALDDLRDGDPARAVHTLTTHGRITTTATLQQLRDRLVDDWWHVTRTHGSQAGVMIALRVADVDALNHLARQRLADAGALTGPVITAAHRTFQTGDRVVARRNQRQPTPGATVPVMNGQRGTISTTNPTARTVTVEWDGGCATVVSAGYLDAGHLDHGYAITGHRAQGLTVDHTWIAPATRRTANGATSPPPAAATTTRSTPPNTTACRSTLTNWITAPGNQRGPQLPGDWSPNSAAPTPTLQPSTSRPHPARSRHRAPRRTLNRLTFSKHWESIDWRPSHSTAGTSCATVLRGTP